ncbi:MAG: polysaccharide biosynthesis/export family protein [Gammaproteobacteria bacterium]|nr:polysaccharide biosynthesis/export family protein [Gammaproteobacteria bacterium]
MEMKPLRTLLAMTAIAFVIALPQQALAEAHSSATTDGYEINAGDVMIVTVWKEEDLQRQVLVLPDGMISFPLAGDIQAAGKTIAQVRDELTERLSRYIPDPVVTVTVEQVLGNRAYVLGQVQRPGEFVAGSQLDVTQALAMAGGFTPFAQVNDIKVLRRENGTLRAIEFRYGDIEKGKRLEQNVLLEPGDVIVVP